LRGLTALLPGKGGFFSRAAAGMGVASDAVGDVMDPTGLTRAIAKKASWKALDPTGIMSGAGIISGAFRGSKESKEENRQTLERDKQGVVDVRIVGSTNTSNRVSRTGTPPRKRRRK